MGIKEKDIVLIMGNHEVFKERKVASVPTTQQIADISEIIDVKSKRDALAERIEVLEKVKTLVLLPNIEMVTARQIAEFYEVPLKTVQKTYSRYRKEIQSDGYTSATGKKLVVDNMSTTDYSEKSGYYDVSLSDGSSTKIAMSTVGLYSIRAVLRFGMLLRDSKIAVEVRNQLLNIRDNADMTMRTKAVDAELLELREKAAKYDALVGDLPTSVKKSYETIINYVKEQKEAADAKVIALDAKLREFVEDESLISFADVGTFHLHGISSQQVRSFLQEQGVLSARKVSGIYKPIGEYKSLGWFKAMDKTHAGTGVSFRHLYVTRKGILGIQKLYENFV
ncbi:phage antirepressor KilAC domain-containing protein [Bacillus thuringiensis]|nr:phage antirepressor KilAC domain-containing protein [Bacillus thuringiensis]